MTGRSSATRLLVVAAVLTMLVAGSATTPVSAHEDGEEESPPVFLVHGMPDTVLEVEVGNDRRLKGLRFGQFYNLRAFAGTTLSFGFKILETGELLVRTDGFAVPSDRSSSLVVHHGRDGAANLTAFENHLDPLEPGTGRLIFRHLADAPPFDVVVNGDVVLTGVEHGWEETVELDAGSVSLSLVGGGDDNPLAGPVEVPVTAGDRTVVYGFGGPDGQPTIVTDVIHGSDDDVGGPPLQAVALSTALAVAIGLVGLTRIRRRSKVLEPR